MENLFCTKHLIGLLWTSILIFILLYLSRRFEKKIGVKKLLKIGAITLVSLELIKFVYIYSRDGSISIFYIPLQFCSLFLYAYPVVAFGNKKIVDFVLPFAFVCGLMAGLLALILPTNILGDPSIGWLDPENFIYTLSFVYHSFLIYYSLYLVISKYYIPRIKDTWKIVVISMFFAFIAQLINRKYDLDLMLINKGNGSPLQFVLNNYGYVTYYVSLTLLLVLISFLILGLTKLILRIKNKDI